MLISTVTIASFALTCTVIELTPGPNMAYLAMLSAGNGRRAGFAATLGIALGLLVLGVAAALGLATVIANSHTIYEALRWSGVGYLLWLVWEGWRDAAATSPEKALGFAADSTFFKRGLVTNLLNPKAAIFYIAVLPEFVDLAQPAAQQTVLLSVLYVTIATSIHSAIVGLAGAARPFLDDPGRTRLMRRSLSIGLACIALWFGYSTRH